MNLRHVNCWIHLPTFPPSSAGMAASFTGAAGVPSAVSMAPSNPTTPVTVGTSPDNPTLHYSMILEHLIGDKRPVKELNPAVMGALPVPAKTDEQKMIERGMESCAFKTVLACVGGNDADCQGEIQTDS